MKKLWFLLTVAGVYLILSMKLYADTVRSQFPLWVTSCDGYTQGIAPWGCNTGEVRFLGTDDEVHSYYLWNPFVGEVYSPTFEPVLAFIAPQLPIIPAVDPVPSTVPEPNYFGIIFWALAIIGLLCFWKSGEPRT